MIHIIKGTVTYIDEHCVTIIPENTGIGFEVHVVQPAALERGKMAELFTHMHWNQETGPTLYGFKTSQERALFVLIIGCSGIGPKIALTILQQVEIADFVRAIQAHDLAWLSKLKGIGAKKAEQLVVQLKSKMDGFASIQSVEMCGVAVHLKQLSDVLQSLNYSRAEIQQALTHVRESIFDATIAFEPCLRKALIFLSQRG